MFPRNGIWYVPKERAQGTDGKGTVRGKVRGKAVERLWDDKWAGQGKAKVRGTTMGR